MNTTYPRLSQSFSKWLLLSTLGFASTLGLALAGTPVNSEALLTNYFDIEQGAPSGSEVIGRVNLSDNRLVPDTPIPSSYQFQISGSTDFSISKHIDPAGRVFGVLSTSSDAVTENTQTYSFDVELYDDSTLVARSPIEVQVRSKTVWAEFKEQIFEYCLDRQSRMWGRHYYDDATVATLIERLETDGGQLAYIVTGSGNDWNEDTEQPIEFYDYTTEATLQTYGEDVVGPSQLADQFEFSATTIASLARAMHKNAAYSSGANRERLKAALYDALEQYFIYFPMDSFGNFLGIDYNDRTHQWRFSDPISGALIYLLDDLLADTHSGNPQAYLILGQAQEFYDKVNFSLPPQELDPTHERYYNPENLAESLGAWSDANRHHRIRSWAVSAAVFHDYNRPISYHEYWYPGYAGWGEADTTILPGWQPMGIFEDLKFWVDSNTIRAKQFGQAGLLPDGTMSHHVGARQDLAMLAYGYEWLVDTTLEVGGMLKNTPFRPENAVFDFTADVLLFSYPQLIYKNGIDFQSVGRSFDSNSLGSFGTGNLARDITSILEWGAENSIEREDELITLKGELENGTQELAGTFAWWTNDFLIHRQDTEGGKQGYYMSVKMQSQRTRGAESFNYPAGFHNGSGVLQVKVTGQEYDMIRYDWDQHMLPGITEEWRSDDTPKQSEENLYNPNAYAGTVSDGDFGLASFQYDSDASYASASANKSYFFPGDYVIALGSKVNRTRTGQNGRIMTVVDQDKLMGDMTYFTGNGTEAQVLGMNSARKIGPNSDPALPYKEQVKWYHQGNKGYIIFPIPGETLKALLYSNANVLDSDPGTDGSETGRLPIFWIAVNHKENPSNAKYHYAIIPNVTASEMPDLVDQFLEENEVILSDDLHAVYTRSATQKTVQASFFSAGTATFSDTLSITVDKPAMVQARLVGDSWKVTVVDPTHHDDPSAGVINKQFKHPSLDEANQIQVTINRPLLTSTQTYLTQGIEKRFISGQTAAVVGTDSSTTITFELPDVQDAASYSGRQNLYLGMPASITVSDRDHDFDGHLIENDAFPSDPTEWLDTDQDKIGNNADLDDDGDAMSDAWEIEFGLQPLLANDAALDLDTDGQTNLQEFIAGTDPSDLMSRFEVKSLSTPDSENPGFLQWTAVIGKTYILEHSSTGLNAEDWSAIDSHTATQTQGSFTLPSSSENLGFYRIRVSLD